MKEKTTEEILRTITDNMFDLVALTDTAANIKYITNSYSILGYSPEYITGRNLIEFVHPEDRPFVKSELLKFIDNSETPARVECRYCCADGGYVWLEIVGKPVKDENLSTIEFVFSSRDITKRKDIEYELKESRKKYQTIFENVPAGIVTYDKTGIITDCNSKFVEIIGSSREALIGLDAFNLPNKQVTETLKSSVEGKTSTFEGEYRSFTADKVTTGRMVAAPFLSEDGKVTGGIAIVEDITERRQMEERLNSLLEEKDLILKEAHHRIKNNMNTVQSLLHMHAAYKKENPEDVLKDAAGRLQTMSILYDKLYDSETFTELNIRDYLSQLVVEILSVTCNHPAIETEIIIDDFTLHTRILTPLGIIINELITNSVKHAFKGRDKGSISLSVSKKDNRAALIYSDNGNGLPESFSSENSRTLGMRLITLLVKQIKGSITIDDSEGAKFIIEFNV